MNILWGLLSTQQGNGLNEIDVDKNLKKIATKDLTILTFKRLDNHITQCAYTSKLTLGVLVFLAVCKLADMLNVSSLMLKLMGVAG